MKLRYTWKQDNKGSWVRNSETCCGKKNVKSPKACTRANLPVRKKRPGNSGECRCPGSATTMEEAVVVDLKRATCSDRGEGYVESAVGDCYMQAKDSEHGCRVPSLLTCVRAYPADAREKCKRLHCQTDATGAQKAGLASCIERTLETWLQVNERCRKDR